MSYECAYSSNEGKHHGKGNDYEYHRCNCCPYGYHIDLDFVRYCESIGQSERTASINRRKDRRRQRQSMDVLLGLAPSTNFQQITIPSQVTITEQHDEKEIHVPRSAIDMTLVDAVVDFEKTLQRSKNTLSNNLPDVTAVSGVHRSPSAASLSAESASSLTILPYDNAAMTKEFDSISLESNGLSPLGLQSIREQMALSLKRMRQLEEQVKLIPVLESEISRLENDNHQVKQRLQMELIANMNTMNHIASNAYRETRHLNDTGTKLTQRRDFGVNCTVLTRSIGVGHQYPNTRSISTTTLKAYTDNDMPAQSKNLVNTSSQTMQSMEAQKVSIGVQVPLWRTLTTDTGIQTIKLDKHTTSKGTMVMPQVTSESTQASVDVQSIAVSDDTIIETICQKCADAEQIASEVCTGKSNRTISLALLGKTPQEEADENIQEKRWSVGCQYESFSRHKSTQHDTKVASKGCQNVAKQSHKFTQPELVLSLSKNTDTLDLLPKTTDAACNSNDTKPDTNEVQVQTDNAIQCQSCISKETVDQHKKEEHQTPSRIPRLSERRKFERQITYTKISAAPVPTTPTTPTRLSGLDLSKSSDTENEPNAHLDKFPQPRAPRSLTEDTTVNAPSHNYEHLAYVERKKAVPSKEMQAAMKVLNDSLQKGHTKNIENQVKNAVHIILQEWFKVSSHQTANPLDVEDYLDNFEEVSSVLLEYVVNMVDASGNTAMHYAVSHGNFDVVSILLDSKVCDINKQNKAGYTSVMLVSLAEVRSQTHANVVKHLFSLADVNIRAKQHGQTALMLAVSHGRLDMVKMLLEAGADINIQDEDGSTALMCAAEHGHIDIVKYFLSQPDCDSRICDVDGSTALKIAMEAGHRHIGVLLYAHERSLSGGPEKIKKPKSATASPKAPASPLVARRTVRTSSSNK